ncbi:phage portal protein [Nakamurella panacisegetis]|uniref:phage portal protein n=1 Tax=Nakamurella panacisegetis TaxID=1090615 RepID=UPI0012FE5887|nr:phage portal protein [Nakamurella panacisegetis]
MTDDELGLFMRLGSTIIGKAGKNRRKRALYDLRHEFKHIGIAVPPQFQGIEAVAGWPAMAVDVLNEGLRAETLRVPSGADLGLGQMWTENNLTAESTMAHADCFIYGPSFAALSAGVTAHEPEVLVSIESPTSTAAIWNRRERRVTAGLLLDTDDTGTVTGASLMLPDQTITLGDRDGKLTVLDRRVHNLDAVLLVPLVNNPRTDRPWGRSEINRAVIAFTAGATRTMLGAELAREFFGSPQRAVLGADEDTFKRADGSKVSPWEAYLGRFLALARDEDGNLPTVQQFAAASPQPYFDQIRMYSQLFSGETAIPASYLGFVTENPSSAEAIDAAQARMVIRRKNRALGFGASWANVGRLSLLIRDGSIPDEARAISTVWMEFGTPTPAATTDQVIKKVQANILPADSDVTLEELGYSPETIERIHSDRRRGEAAGLISSLSTLAANSAPATPAAAPVVAPADSGAAPTA